jgi:hypothetical protein
MAKKRKKKASGSPHRTPAVRASGTSQEGALRPSHAPFEIHAMVFIKNIPKNKVFPIKLATVPTSFRNAQWKLEKRGSLYMIVSKWDHPRVPKLVMEVGGESAGSAIMAAAPTGAPNQLWEVEPFGVMRKFRFSKNRSLVLQSVGEGVEKGTDLTIAPNSEIASPQWWVFD